jgi:hypothetical protein
MGLQETFLATKAHEQVEMNSCPEPEDVGLPKPEPKGKTGK